MNGLKISVTFDFRFHALCLSPCTYKILTLKPLFQKLLSHNLFMSTAKTNTELKTIINGFTNTIKTIANLFSSSSSTYSEPHTPSILRLAGCQLCRLCRRLRRRQKPPKHPIIKTIPTVSNTNGQTPETETTIRVATFNAGLFSMAPAVPTATAAVVRADRPMKGILKQEKLSASKRRVSINLPEGEISSSKGKSPEFSKGFSFRATMGGSERSVLDVLKEIEADVIGLQNVKAEEEKGMKPLSDLAQGLGMEYVFADSWAPEYGNAILSRWPIKHWRVQKIFDDSDFRYVLKFSRERILKN